jgi:hypothetical protein
MGSFLANLKKKSLIKIYKLSNPRKDKNHLEREYRINLLEKSKISKKKPSTCTIL